MWVTLEGFSQETGIQESVPSPLEAKRGYGYPSNMPVPVPPEATSLLNSMLPTYYHEIELSKFINSGQAKWLGR